MFIDELINQIENMENAEVFPEGVAANTEDEVKGFHLESDAQADRFLSMYKLKQRKIIENNEALKAARERYKNHFERLERRLNSELERSCEFYKSKLEEYAITKLNGEKGSIKLLNGTIAMKKPQAEISYDEEKVVAWLRAHGQEQFVNMSIKKSDLKKASKKDGMVQKIGDEIIDGIAYTEKPLAFSLPNVAKEMEKERKAEAAKKAIEEINNLMPSSVTDGATPAA